MRRRLFGRILLCLLPLLTVVVLWTLLAFALPDMYSETYLGAFSDKIDAFRAASGRRVIITGGSGAAFAVHCDLLEEELPDYKAVNLGMYAGLGSTVPLDAITDELRAGDIVIFLPEQSGQTLSLYFGSEAMWQAADGRWELLRGVREENWPAMLSQFPYFAARKGSYFLHGTRPAGDGIYARSSFNAFGDIDSVLRNGNTMPGGFDANMPISFDTLPDAEFLAYLNRYADRCAQMGVQFFFGFCPMNFSAADTQHMKDYEQQLSEQLSCPILGEIQDSLLEAGWFYDTNFHLNSAGAVVYTARLAAQLKRALGLPEAVSISLPDMPGAAGADIFRGDDTDADCFRYEKDGDGWRIVGLTELGSDRLSLTVPSLYQEQPVTGFTASAFAGNTKIEAVTVQANVRAIPDGSFDGCQRLREIILREVSPADCAVGSGLLRGTSAMILVEAERLAAYQTNYFWAMHADRIRAMDPASIDDNVFEETGQSLEQTPMEETVLIHYKANGGYLAEDPEMTALDAPVSAAHLRTNTQQAVFVRPGWTLVGWNTAADGTGETIGLGSRAALQPGMTLYALWMEESPADDFDWKQEDQAIWITGYRGQWECCVIPAEIGGFPVYGICSGAFRGASAQTVIVPPSVAVIEPEAFADAALHTLYLSDSLEIVSDESFSGCLNLSELHVNAVTPPVYSISYYASFADKYDWLLSLKGQRKLVLFSGSSTRYGYDSAMLHRYFPDLQPANMGVYAYTNALPQMELILPCMESKDVLLHAPEFDCLNFQMCENNMLDFHFWAMMEANYDCISVLDLRSYTKVFDSFQQYLGIRRNLPARTYEEAPNGYDDDGNNMREPTYNQYGDFIMPRANTKMDVMLKYVRAEYTTTPFTQQRLDSLNREYQRFLDSGIQVLFTYTPRNRSSISEDSTPENRRALDALLREQLCVPIISSIEDSLISGEYFFVIDSHLSSEGVRLHTQHIIKALKPWLESDP